MKVYVVFKYPSCTGSTDDSVLTAIFSKEGYAKQYCNKHNKDLAQYWYDEEIVDEELEYEELEELLNETDN